MPGTVPKDFKIVGFRPFATGTPYRADRNPLSGTGAALRGGRYNVRGIETLYLGKPADVALAEVRHAFARQELQIPSNRYVTQTLDVAFNKVLDLTRAEIRDVIGINEDELAAVLGFHAIVAPSARTEGSNIAVYLTHAAAYLDLRDDRRYFTCGVAHSDEDAAR